MCNAFYYTWLSVHHKRHRPFKARYAFGHRAADLRPHHYNCSHNDGVVNGAYPAPYANGLLPLHLTLWQFILFRLAASFCGVFGFSVMFNSPVKLAASAAVIGALANTLRLELVDLVSFPPAAAAFVGAFTEGILASLLKSMWAIREYP